MSDKHERLERIERQLQTMTEEIGELEICVTKWESNCGVLGRRYRSIASRIVLSAKRLEALVREYSMVK